MKDIYAESTISKQAHIQMLQRLQKIEEGIPYYEGLITQVREMHPGMGLRTIYEKTQPEGIGRDHFIELGIQLGLCLDPVMNRKRTTYAHRSNKYPNLLVGADFTDINQVWATDITYFKLGEPFYYISLIMDLYSRRILGYFAADNMHAEASVKALKMALDLRGIKNYNQSLIHHSDRGSQYISDVYTNMLMDHGAQISMCTSVYENTMQERVNKTIKNQYLKNWNIKSFSELSLKLEKAVFAYNYDKPHSSLGKLTPVEYENQLQNIDMKDRTVLNVHTNDIRDNMLNPNQLNLF